MKKKSMMTLLFVALLALAMLGVAAACVAAGAPDGITRTAALLGVGFITALSLHRLGRK